MTATPKPTDPDPTAPSLQTCLWFDGTAEEAARRYCALVPDSRITAIFPRRDQPETAFLVHLTLAGQRFSFLNAGPGYPHSYAASIELHLETQAEVDRLWDAFLDDGGTASRCGWLQDRFGIHWQIIPRALIRLMQTPDPAKAARVTAAMMEMVKLDAAALEAAAAG